MADEKPEKTTNADEAAVEETPAAEEAAAVEETTPEAPAAEAEAPVETTPATEEPTPVEAEGEGPAEIEEAVADAEAPDAAPEAAAEPEPEAPAAPAKRAKSQKHLPRSARRQRSKPAREKPAQRKPIVRGEQAVKEIGRHQERRGVVVSDAMDKTIVVKVDVIRIHPKYKKVIRRSRKFHAHDERNEAHVGDTVRIVETRPLSKTKNWRLAEVVEVAR
jgi:small subunit ribosomal protein S17